MSLDQQTLDGWMKAYPGLEDLYPATGMQLGLVFHSLLDGRKKAYATQLQMDFEGGFDADVFRRAWEKMLARHAIFRTAFVGLDRDQPLQLVVKRARLQWREEDWRALDREAQEEAFARYREDDKGLGFDFSHAPLMRMSLMRLSQRKYRWLWTHHHSLLDGWSVATVIRELLEQYEGLLSGRKVTLPGRANYRDYIAWLSTQDRIAAKAYWRETLSEVTPAQLDLPQRQGSAEDEEQGEQVLVISAPRTEMLRQVAQRHGVTLSTVMQGAWAYLLHRYSGGARNVVFGQTVSGRSAVDVAGIEAMVGLFINTLPASVEVARGADIGEWLRRLQQEHAQRESHAYLPLVEIQQSIGLQAGEALFDTLLVFENYRVDESLKEAGSTGSVPRFAVSGVGVHQGTGYGLTLVVAPATELSLKLLYQTARYGRKTIAALLGSLGAILDGLADARIKQVQDLPYLGQADYAELVERRGATMGAHPHDECIHELFEEEARLRPDAIALVFEDCGLTYRELNERANGLAHRLIESGAGPEVRVGLYMQRPALSVIGMLGVLKSGGCYVPLDPALPALRLAHLIRDGAIELMVSETSLDMESLAGNEAKIECVSLNGAASTANPITRVCPANLACAVYADDGVGVLVQHRSLNNLPMLLSGDTLHLIPEKTAGSANLLSSWVLGPDAELLPRGVAGELYLGGAQLPRGYLNRPGLTAEKLIPHPFGREPGERLYRTGELVRWLPEGTLELLGQVPDRSPTKGRVGRKALRARLEPEHVPPEGVTEQLLAQLWCIVLERERIGRHDNFFALGGHSLLATQLVSRIRDAFSTELPLRELFEQPTLSLQARAIERARGAGVLGDVAMESVSREQPLVLSYAQQRLWFLHRYMGPSAVYNMPLALRLEGKVDEGALVRALEELYRRHESLRTRFESRDSSAVQVIDPPRLGLEAEPVAATEVEAIARAERFYCFDLSGERLSRIRLLHETDWPMGPPGSESGDYVLLITMHHSVTDGWSLGILFRELVSLYRAYANAEESPLAPLRIQYADYAQWQRNWLQKAVLDEQLSYWREHLKGLPPLLRLPTDRPRPAEQTFRGSFERFALPMVLSEQLKALSREQGATLYMTLLSAFAVLLGRYAGQQDVAVGTPIANRTRQETEGLIGFFVNTLVTRHDLSGNPRFVELLARTRDLALEAYAHQDVPFEQLVEELNPERSLSYSPLFQVMFILQNMPIEALELSGLKVCALQAGEGAKDREDAPEGVARFDLTLTMQESVTGLVGSLEYNTDLFERGTIQRLLDHYERLLEAIAASPRSRLSRLQMLSEEEKQRQLLEWNETTRAYPDDSCIHELFEVQARLRPDAIALVHEDVELTYGELNRRANRLASRLIENGVGPEVRVGLCLQRSAQMVIGLLGILKAGGCYVPLDPDYPRKRLDYLLEDAQIDLVVTELGVAPRLLLGPHRDLLLLNRAEPLDKSARWELEEVDSAARGLRPDHPAYLIYTSASTGTPKAVVGLHRSIVNRVSWLADSLGVEAEEVLCQKTSLGFVDHVAEIFQALSAGVPLVILSPALLQAPQELLRELDARRVTQLTLVPSLLKTVVESAEGESARWMKSIYCSGEALNLAGLERLPECFPRARIFNIYGSTEMGADVTCQEIAAESLRAQGAGLWAPIGKGIDNTQAYILDAEGQLTVSGAVGELHVGGVCLARGYFRRSGLTAERFAPHPFSQKPGARLYRTGDLARWSPDGTLEYLGRVDHQVKVRGFRIELGEVESALLAHETVRAAVVVARENSIDQRLVGYVVAKPGAPADSALIHSLRSRLQEQLPSYMVPSAFVMLERMPLTPTGKVDRRALPAPEADAEYTRPEGVTEELLAQLWCVLLKRERVGRHDNFFELGGHSLLAMQLGSRIREAFATGLPVRDLFEHPTLSSQASAVERARGAGAPNDLPLETVPRNEPLPLSYAQQRLWFLQQYMGPNAVYNMPLALRLHGEVTEAALMRSLEELQRRHESLRTRFESHDGRTVQVIDPPGLELEVERVAAAEVQVIVRSERFYCFDLSGGRLCRIRLLRETGWPVGPPCSESGDYVLLVTMHHSVSDGLSLGIFVRELVSLYHAYVNGESSPLTPLPVQYADYARWQRRWLQGAVLAEQVSYWRKQLKGLPPLLTLPTDRARPAEQTFRGSLEPFSLPASLAQKLQALSRERGVTLYMTLLSAFAVLLGRYSGQQDVAVGTAVANRTRRETEGLIGFFVNTLVMRHDLSGDPCLTDFLERTRAMALQAYAHQDIPFEQLVEELNPQRSLSHSQLFQVAFSLQNAPFEAHELPGLAVRALRVDEGEKDAPAGDSLAGRSVTDAPEGTSRFDLTLILQESPAGLMGVFEYNTDLFDRDTIRRMSNHYARLLEAIVTSPRSRLSQLQMLGEAERHQQLVEWNATAPVPPDARCIHELFESQVERVPDAAAVVHEGQVLSYGELNARANRLAHCLRERGVEPDVRVGICVERGLPMVIGLLAILKAGGAYVPLDPSYPRQRLSYLLSDSEPVLLLVDEAGRASLAAQSLSVAMLDLDADAPLWAGYSSENPAGVALRPNHMAYVIYTSGSTGKPKGVMVAHRNVVRLLATTAELFHFDARDTWSLFHSMAFDFSVWEIWGALLHGGRLVVVPQAVVRSPEDFYELVCRECVSVLNQTPSAFTQLIGAREGSPQQHALRRVIFGGEALQVRSLERWYERHGDREPLLVNMYGITETCVHVTYRELERADTPRSMEGSPIGTRLPDLRVYLLDRDQQPVPIGVAGEIHVGGAGVARGYLNRPQLTSERFVPDPFSAEPGARLYRAGDLGRFRADGSIEYLGRNDEQVKIRGFRIEPGEIEASLMQHPAVQDAHVLVRDYGEQDRRIVAYLVPSQQNAFPVHQLLRLQREGLDPQAKLTELPNGLTVFHQNASETAFTYEEIFSDEVYVRHGVRIEDEDCILDVGANIGLFTLFAGQRCRNARLYAFEPLPPVFDSLRRNALLYGLNAKVFQCGLADRARQESFTFYPHATVISSRLTSPEEARQVVKTYLQNQQRVAGDPVPMSEQLMNELLQERLQGQQYTCQLKALSEVIAEESIERIDLLKVDVENGELEVLAGIQEGDWPKIRQLVIEVHDVDGRLRQVIDLLESRGYEVNQEQDKLLQSTPLHNVYAVRPRGSVDAPHSTAPARPAVTAPRWTNQRSLLQDLRSFVKERIPEYMVPAAYVLLNEMPLTANGKLDRKALPAPEASVPGSEYVPPEGVTEELLAELWCVLLKCARVGRHANFFELGGHSLLATQLVSRIREVFSTELPVRELFEHATLSSQARAVERARGAGGLVDIAMEPVSREQPLRLSYAQQRLWFLYQYMGANAVYNIPLALRLQGEVNEAALVRSLEELYWRHESLRTRFEARGGSALQVIDPSGLALEVEAVSAFETQAIARSERLHGFELPGEALCRIRLLRETRNDYVLLVTMHHIVSDGWSLGIFFRELVSLYRAYGNAESSPLAPLPIQYADYAQWQRRWLQGAVLDQQVDYWREALQGLPPLLMLPTDRPRPAEQTFRGSTERFALPLLLSEKLQALSREQGVTLYMTLLSAFAVLLGRYSGQQDVAVGTPIANRMHRETEGLIGFFVNMLVLRHDLSGDPRFVKLLERTRDMALQAYAHQDVPFEQLVEALHPERSASHSPLFQVAFGLVNTPFGAVELPGLTALPLREDAGEESEGTTRFDLTLNMQESASGLVGGVEYNTDLFDRDTIRQLLTHYARLLEAIVAAPQARLSQLQMLSEEERRRQLIEWNASSWSSPRDKSVQELFEEQVECSPEAIAAVDGDRRLTYREVNERANALAHGLIEQGVVPGSVVGVCVAGDVERLVGVLGILKAGAAYVSLNAEDPAERLDFLLEDSGAELTVTQSWLRDEVLHRYAITNPRVAVSPSELACVRYEADEAGVTVGRMIPHSGLVADPIGAGQEPCEGWRTWGAAHYVLDRDGELLPIGAIGDLYVGGEGVSWGYRHHPSLTAARFVPNALSAVAGERLYRTGERARWRADGTLDLIGREEPSGGGQAPGEDLFEIERALSSHEAVREAAVAMLEAAGARPCLVAYVVERVSGAMAAEQLVAQLKAYLRTRPRLNRVPDEWMVLTSLPRTVAGAVNRSKLPQPQGWEADLRSVAPRTPLERTLVEVWQEQLGIERVGIEDNYFVLGGDSIRSIALVAEARQRGVDFSIKDLFAYPTVSTLALALERGDVRGGVEVDEVIEPFALLTQAEREQLGRRHDMETVEDAYPLSMMQQGMVLESLRHADLKVYQNGHYYHFNDAWDLPLFEQALCHLVARHPMLRTVYDFSGERPLQLVLKQQGTDLKVIDVRHLDAAAIQTALDEWIQKERSASLDVSSSLWRLTIHVLSDKRFIFGMFIHHAQWDGWSLESFATELYATYGRLRRGKPVPEHRPLPSYKQFIALEQAALSSAAQQSYWTQKLEGAAVPWWTGREKSVSTFIPWEISRRSSHALTGLARRLGVQEKSVWCSVYLALLSLLCGTEEAVGTVMTQGRPEIPGGEKVIGVFLNALPIRVGLSGRRWVDLIEATDRELREQHAFRHYPLAEIQRQTGLDQSASMFNYSNWHVYYEGVDREGTAEEWTPQKIGGWQETNYLLSVLVHKDDRTRAHYMGIHADSRVFDAALCERIRGYVDSIIRAIASDATAVIEKTTLLSEAEQRQQLLDWNATACAYPDDKCIHDLFAEQVGKTPDRIALVFEGQSLTYAELDARANQLAHYLIDSGAGPDTRVALCVERSVEMVIGLLGILKAGGAYVPLEPGHPLQRLTYMMSDSTPVAILTHTRVEGSVREHLASLASGAPVVDLLADAAEWEACSRQQPGSRLPALTSAHVAYVIYTSGSTGQPKGVMVGHRGLVNRLWWMQQAYGLGEHDAVLQKTPFSFDVSVWEFLWPLTVGAKLVMAQPEGHKDPRYLIDAVRTQQITVMHFVPSMLQAFLEAAGVSHCSSLSRVVCSGEALSGTLARRFKRCLPRVDLQNLYGPTEATVDVTAWSCNDPREESVPIGHPIANTQMFVLDERQQLLPAGVPGELYIGGVGLAVGYLKRPDLTAERFVPSGYPQMSGERLYRTGDLARWLPDGSLEYLGRLDHQVKVRGFRIELGEIEASLMQHPAVQDAHVLVKDYGEQDRRIIAYLVPSRESARPVRQLLRMQMEGLDSRAKLTELPNGLTVFHQNASETAFSYEEIFTDQVYARHGIRLEDEDCIFDVGANIGLFMLFAGQRCRNARLYAFEPLPPVFDSLRRNAALYGLNAKVFECGLADRARQESFTFYPHATVISSHLTSPEEARQVVRTYLQNQQRVDGDAAPMSEQLMNELLQERLQGQQYTCQLKALSEVIAEEDIERIDLLKIDVENGELEVLRGIQASDWPKIRQLVIEVHDVDGRLRQVINLLELRGYEVNHEQDKLLHSTALHNVYAVRPRGSVDAPRSSAPVQGEDAKPRWTSGRSLLQDLRGFVRERIPEYMAPAAYVLLDEMPLTANGKLDRKALPAPEGETYAHRHYEAPQGEIERALGQLWQELLRVEQVGRHDNFFQLGGHSLLAVRLIERMRQQGLKADVRALFSSPTLIELAEAVAREGAIEVQVPENRIAADCERITPQLLPLVALEQEEIDRIVERVPGGARNVQDIYPLAPLQEGILFHYLMSSAGDAYLLPVLMSFDTRERLERFLTAVQWVIGRHDILRTAVQWEELSRPVQVVWRQARLAVEEVELTSQDAARELRERFDPRRCRLDIREAPLQKALVGFDREQGRWLLLLLNHHLMFDHTALEVILSEAQAHLQGEQDRLAAPVPFREFVAQARLGVSAAQHEEFFRGMLGDIEEPTAPFGWLDVLGDGGGISEASVRVDEEVARGIRRCARTAGVSAASLCHLAWAQVLARLTDREEVVFGTVLFGRLHGAEGATRGVGLFINTLPLRLSIGGQGALEALRSTHERLGQLLRHEHASLALAQRCSGALSEAPLFTTLFNYRHASLAGSEQRRRAWEGIQGLYVEERTNYPLLLSVDDVGDAFGLTVQVREQVEPRRICELMHEALAELVQALESSAQTSPLGIRLPAAKRFLEKTALLSETERHRQLVEWNAPARGHPDDRCIHALFEEQSRLRPDAIALVHEGSELTYEELNARANRLAHYLREKGVGPDRRVGICVERGLSMVVGLLGILKAGGAYVPLDPSYPRQRLSYLLSDSAPVLLLVDGAGHAALSDESLSVAMLDLEADAPLWLENSNESPAGVELRPHHMAYVIYTSGSTGKPKGVVVEHRNVVRLFATTARWFDFDARDTWSLFHSMAFDFSVWEIWGALLHGGRLVVVPQAVVRSPEDFYELVCRERVSVLNQTPSAFTQLIGAQERSPKRHALRRVIFGGEALQMRALQRWYERHDDHEPLLVNMYGITETCVHVTYRELQRADTQRPMEGTPIGTRLPDLRVYLLDRYQQLVPTGVVGEIYVGGAGVARGYLNRPQLTSQRFVPDPFSAEHGARLYRAGDLGRFRADGSIEYLGRNDEQVKVRGYRIELGEIESVLRRHEAVREAVVLAREDKPGERSLVAYVVAREETRELQLSLLEHLHAHLPDYMVPAAFVALDALPLTVNRKIDVEALPMPDDLAYARAAYEPPETAMEKVLAGLWRENLGLEKVGTGDNYFSLGGDSIRSISLVAAAKRRGLRFSVKDLFSQRTIKALAQVAESIDDREELPQLQPFSLLTDQERTHIGERYELAAIEDAFPLSTLQQGMIYHSLARKDLSTYHDILTNQVRERWDLLSFRRALSRVVSRHGVLRTVFDLEAARPIQVVFKHAEVDIEVVDIPDISQASRIVEQWIEHERQQGIDLSSYPWKIRVHVLPDHRFVLGMSFHHALYDGWSNATFLHELLTAYKQQDFVDESDAPPSYRYFVAAEQEALSSPQNIAYWRGKLEGAKLPWWTGDLRERSVSFIHEVSEESSNALRALAATLGVQEKSVWTAVYLALVVLLDGSNDVVASVATHGRPEIPGGEKTLGLFLNSLPVRVDTAGMRWRDLVLAAEAQLQALHEVRHFPLIAVQTQAAMSFSASLFNFVSFHAYAENVADRELIPGGGFEETNYRLTFQVQKRQGVKRYGVLVSLDPSVFDPDFRERIRGYVVAIIERLVGHSSERIDKAALLEPAERTKLLATWNATAHVYPDEACIHELFEARVQWRPDAIALVHEGSELTYRELNRRANRLAHRLMEHGVGPEVRVGLCLPRSALLVIGILGILKAGGAYVPLDPEYPRKRLEYLLEDARIQLVVTEPGVAARVSGVGRQLLLLTEADPLNGLASWWLEDVNSVALGLRPDHPAYLIYTSASTGTPKGVVGLHRSIVNRVNWLARSVGVGAQEVLCQKTNVGFVDHVAEIFQALSAGVPLVIVSSALLQAPRELLRAFDERRVTQLTLVPSLLKTLLEAGQGEQARWMKSIYSSGEALNVSGLDRLIECFPQAWLFNIYGSTEMGADVTCQEVPVESLRMDGTGLWAAIGKGIDNTQAYILDGDGQLAVSGAVGELHVGGVCLARGYFQQAGLTAERFVPHPFSREPGERLYRTGDLARWLPDGALEYRGRVDHQVKMRGFRIELGEIESVLLGHAAVRDAVVVARDESGDKRLVGYVVTKSGVQAGEVTLIQELRARLQEQLPGYMVPSAFVVLGSLPLTATGKLDRKALPAPQAPSAREEYAPPEGVTEEVLAKLWCELLKRERVGRDDNFFDLGGHSLLATQLLARIRGSFRIDFPIRDLFDRQTLQEQALAIETCRETSALSFKFEQARRALVAAGEALEAGEI